MSLRFVIIGGGPAGTQGATVAARLGAEVTLIERDIVGGAAHLWDCVPSKAMIATGAAFGEFGAAESMGLAASHAAVDLDQTWIWSVTGIAAGIAIIAVFALFEKRRDDVLRMVDGLKQWEA